jgi:hypothetical protein
MLIDQYEFQRMIDIIWLQPGDEDVNEVVNAVVPPVDRFQDICCGLGMLILCCTVQYSVILL